MRSGGRDQSQCWGRRDQDASCSDPTESRELATQREEVPSVRSLLIGHPTVGTSQEAWPPAEGGSPWEAWRHIGMRVLSVPGAIVLARGSLSCPESDLRLPGHQDSGSQLTHNRPLCTLHLLVPAPTSRTPDPSQLMCRVLVAVHDPSTPRLWSFESQVPPHDEEAVGSLDIFGGAKGWREAAENRSRCLNHPGTTTHLFSPEAQLNSDQGQSAR